MEKNKKFGVWRLGSNGLAHFLLVGSPWVSYFTFLILFSFICKGKTARILKLTELFERLSDRYGNVGMVMSWLLTNISFSHFLLGHRIVLAHFQEVRCSHMTCSGQWNLNRKPMWHFLAEPFKSQCRIFHVLSLQWPLEHTLIWECPKQKQSGPIVQRAVLPYHWLCKNEA